MKKIIQRTRRFEKAYIKLQKHVQFSFLKKLAIFIDSEFHPSLNTHQLKGERKDEWSFSVTNDVRAIYTKETNSKCTIIRFTFIDIGGHNQVY